MFMGYDIPETFIHRSKNKTDYCVVSGKDPVTLKAACRFDYHGQPCDLE